MHGNAGPVQMEKHHQVRPTKSKVVKRHPAIFNPLKVRLLLYVLCNDWRLSQIIVFGSVWN
jgi:hypothetical protein